MKQQGIIFDFNGTLFWDSQKHYDAWYEMSKRLRGSPFNDYEMVHCMFGRTNENIMEYAMGRKPTPDEVKKYSLEKELSYTFPKGADDPEIFITLVHSDATYTVFKKTNILTPSDISFYLFDTVSGTLIGKMTGFPEVIYGGKAVDIIDYDDYFNIKEKTLTDFLEKE